jgi:IMP and pyridine-specific 5'-nucleotidase
MTWRNLLMITSSTETRSKLKLLVPSVGTFYTPLSLEEAFLFQDERRKISSRRFVSPSFNDIRLYVSNSIDICRSLKLIKDRTLNTAQIVSIARGEGLELITFDGDVTLYDDGQSLTDDNPVIPRIIKLLAAGVKVAIVTAAGYTEASKYYERLYGLLEAVRRAVFGQRISKPELAVLGGESNFLFVFDPTLEHCLKSIPTSEWLLDSMRSWTEENITELLDVAEDALKECINTLQLSAEILRKPRAVGIIASNEPGARKFSREQLEETVLVTQQIVEMSSPKVPFCAFNGGNDVFVDIGDKSWGVLACQSYLGGVSGSRTLHVGDQFLSAGSNDFKARQAAATAWIASPAETVALLDEYEYHVGQAEQQQAATQ